MTKELSAEEQAERKAFSRRFLKVVIEQAEDEIRELIERRDMAIGAWEEITGEKWIPVDPEDAEDAENPAPSGQDVLLADMIEETSGETPKDQQ